MSSQLSQREQELELQRQQLELERKELELEMKRLELAKLKASSSGERTIRRKKKKKKGKAQRGSKERNRNLASSGDAARAKRRAARAPSPKAASPKVASPKATTCELPESAPEPELTLGAAPSTSEFRRVDEDAYRPRVLATSGSRGGGLPLKLGLLACAGLAVGIGLARVDWSGAEELALLPSGNAPPAPAPARDEPVPRAPLRVRAERGDGSAMLELGRRSLAAGELVAARSWLRKARGHGDSETRNQADALFHQVSERIRAEGLDRHPVRPIASVAPPVDEAPADVTAARARAEDARRSQLAARVEQAEVEARGAQAAAELARIGQVLDAAEADELATSALREAVAGARLTLQTRRIGLQTELRRKAQELARDDPGAALALSSELRALGVPSADVARYETQWREALAAREAEGKARAAEAAAQAQAQREAAAVAAAERDAEREKVVARVERSVRKRVEDFLEDRAPKKLACRTCKGTSRDRCDECRGRLRIDCPGCGGSGSVVTYVPRAGRGITATGGRRIRETCRRCHGARTLDCRDCEDGTVDCKCTEEEHGEMSGYRALAGRRAFWDYISSNGRKGKRRQSYFADVLRGFELADQRGRAAGIERFRIVSIQVEPTEVVVQARVSWALSPEQLASGEAADELYTTTWIRERGKFWLRTPQDTAPEPLFD